MTVLQNQERQPEAEREIKAAVALWDRLAAERPEIAGIGRNSRMLMLLLVESIQINSAPKKPR